MIRLFVGGRKIESASKVKPSEAALQVNLRNANIAAMVEENSILQFNHTVTPRFLSSVSTS